MARARSRRGDHGRIVQLPDGENHSTPEAPGAIIFHMPRYAFPAAHSAVADAPKKAAVLLASDHVAAFCPARSHSGARS
ncbi:hypothetical protein FFZ77_01570 [Streptomyces katsurahamanus]|uniref:CheB-type methylesterase domain-containing protein n=1 Tax=Streptomyces katsurahamanus TaxID=2577098 RepID=A0ABW9NM23_9ACTN|nr:hypothetical protein [Streptomyces katsurahamanus]